MLLDRHFGFMHIARVAQSCRLDNKAELVQSHHESINPSKKFIGTRISMFTVQSIGASNQLIYLTFKMLIAEHKRLLCGNNIIHNKIHAGVWAADDEFN